MSAVQLAKRVLRRRMKTDLAALTLQDRVRQSADVVRQLLKLPQYLQSTRVAVYLHMQDELHTDAIVQDIIDSGKQCYVPRYESDSRHMDMVLLTSWEDALQLPTTRWQVRQPDLSESRALADPSALQLLLVPGLAFTVDGARLGRGRGYYDTFLHRCRCVGVDGVLPYTVGLALTPQICPDVPTEDTDVPLDLVLSPLSL